jgi:hypothetical protein
MDPTPTLVAVSQPTAAKPWTALVVIGLVTVLFIVGLITGQISLSPSKTRKAARRGLLTIDAVLATPEKQAAIEYIRDEEHLIQVDQRRGDGDSDDAPD